MYATLDEVKEFLGISVTTHDSLLTSLLTKVTELIDDYCKRTFGTPVSEKRNFIIREEKTGKLFIPDLIGVTTLKINDSGVSSEEYSLEPLNAPSNEEPYGWISLKNSYFYEDDEVEVDGTWGYWTEVPKAVNLACILWVVRLFRKKDQSEGRITSESLGDYSVSYSRDEEETEEGVTRQNPEELLNPYKRRELISF